MQTLRVGTLIGALIATCFLISALIFEAIDHAGVPRVVTSLLYLTAQTLWFGLLASHCCCVVERNFDARTKRTQKVFAAHAGDILDAITKAVEEAGDRRATQAHLDTLERLARQPVAHRGPTLVPVDRP